LLPNLLGRVREECVDKQLEIATRAALRIGYLTLQRDMRPPGADLIVKLTAEHWWLDPFFVRWHWSDVLGAARSDASIASLASKGGIERIGLEYWPQMCLNPAPPELFEDGDGAPKAPEDVENPQHHDVTCHRVH
jgi:hypothetical protein